MSDLNANVIDIDCLVDKVEKKESIKTKMISKADEYMRRAEQLKVVLDGAPGRYGSTHTRHCGSMTYSDFELYMNAKSKVLTSVWILGIMQ